MARFRCTCFAKENSSLRKWEWLKQKPFPIPESFALKAAIALEPSAQSNVRGGQAMQAYQIAQISLFITVWRLTRIKECGRTAAANNHDAYVRSSKQLLRLRPRTAKSEQRNLYNEACSDPPSGYEMKTNFHEKSGNAAIHMNGSFAIAVFRYSLQRKKVCRPSRFLCL